MRRLLCRFITVRNFLYQCYLLINIIHRYLICRIFYSYSCIVPGGCCRCSISESGISDIICCYDVMGIFFTSFLSHVLIFSNNKIRNISTLLKFCFHFIKRVRDRKKVHKSEKFLFFTYKCKKFIRIQKSMLYCT